MRQDEADGGEQDNETESQVSPGKPREFVMQSVDHWLGEGTPTIVGVELTIKR